MRKPFTTTIEETIQEQFKSACKRDGIKMNEILEAFIEEYLQGNIEVTSKKVLELKRIVDK